MMPANNGSQAVQTPTDAPAGPNRPTGRRPGGSPGRTTLATVRNWTGRHPVAGQVCLLLAYLVLGVLATWPRVTYLVSGLLPNSRDQGIYTWEMWWVAHQVEHFGGLFSTHQLFAPVGAQLAYHDLMPLVCLIMMPVTLTAGPAVSVNLLSVLVPGLLAYAMYRAARLWLPPTGAFASGLFFGLSSMLAWRAWFHLNIAVGAVFLPLALAAAVRLRRDPSVCRALVLGLVLGLCVLVDLESTVLALLIAAAVLVGWLFGGRMSAPDAGFGRRLTLVAAGGGVALVVGSPQVIAMVEQAAAVAPNPAELASNYVTYGVALPQLFTPSPRVAAFGLTALGRLFYDGITTEGMPTFGVTLTVLALLGAVIGWRRRLARIWLVLWLGVAVLALGSVLYLGTHAYTPLPIQDHGQTLSLLMPFTWFVHLPGLSSFREANRFTVLALVPAALLAGSAVTWIRRRCAPALVLVALVCVPELGWSSVAQYGTMPTGLPAVDRAVAADSSRSLVVDVPLGFRSGTVELGPGFPAEELVEATLDGHPRAIGYVARLPESTTAALARHAFYADLLTVQAGHEISTASLPAAIADVRQLTVGWVLVWTPVTPQIGDFLTATGFSLDYQTDGVSVYRTAGRR